MSGVAGPRPPVVMIPGLATTARYFDSIVTAMAADHDVTVFELPGHGRLAGTDSQIRTVEGVATALRRHLDRSGLRAVTLMGWSLGAAVAYTYLDRFGPHRVAKLVSVEMSPRMLSDEQWPYAAFGGLDATGALAVLRRMWTEFDQFTAELVRGCFARDSHPDPALVNALVTESRRCRVQDVVALWTDALTDDWRPRLYRIGLPTLVIHGTASQLFPAGTGAWVANAIPDARLEMFPDSGHMPFIEQPDRFVEMLRAFIAEPPTVRLAGDWL